MSKEIGKDLKILLLDDQEDICLYLKSFLTKRGFKVEVAVSAQAAMNLAKELRPDIAFLDIKLNESQHNGIDVLKFIRNNQPGCKCFMITLVDDKEIIQKCMGLGAVGFLTKPVDVNEMMNALLKTAGEILNGN